LRTQFVTFYSEVLELLKQAQIIIWGEALMTPKICFETLEKKIVT